MKKTGTARFRRSRKKKRSRRVPAASGTGTRFFLLTFPRGGGMISRMRCPPPTAFVALCVFCSVPAFSYTYDYFIPYESSDNRYGSFDSINWMTSGGMKTNNGTFLVRFGQWIVYEDNTPKTQMQFDAKANSPFLEKFSASVMRALNTVEATFANKAGMQILIHCTLNVNAGRNPGAAASSETYLRAHKTTWTSSDFGGKYAGQSAYINDLEMIYKYGYNDRWDSAIASLNFYARSSDGYSKSFYVEEDTSGYASGYDVETITLHEIGHLLGFYRNMTTKEPGQSSLELMMTSKESSLQGGGTEWYFEGETAMFVTGNFDPHVRSPAGDLMADGTYNPGVAREYSLLDLAVFQDLGWTLSEPIPAVPEPSAFGLFAGTLALAFAASSRRRRKRS